MDPSVPWPYAYNRLAQGSSTGELHHFAQAANVNNSSLSNSHNTASNSVSTTSSPLLLQASTASFNASSFMPATGGYESVFSPIFQPKPAHFNPISAQHRHQVLAAQAQAAQAAISKLTSEPDVIRDNYALHHTSLASAAAAQSGSNYFDQTNGTAVNAASVVAALGWQGNNQLSNSFGMLPHENVPGSACSSSSTAKNSSPAVSANPSAYDQFNTHFNSQLNQSNSIIKNTLSQQLPTHQHQQTQQTQQTPLKSLPSPSTSSSMYYQTPATSTYNTPPTNQPLQQTHHQQSFNGSKSSLTDIGNGSSLSKSHADAGHNGVKAAIKIEPSSSSYSPQPKPISPASSGSLDHLTYRRLQNVSFSENGGVNYTPSMSPQYSRKFPVNFDSSASKGAATKTEQFANAQSASRLASTDAGSGRSLPSGSSSANSFYGNLMPAQAQCSPAVVNQGRPAQHSLDTLRSPAIANDISQSVIQRVTSLKGYTNTSWPTAQNQSSADVSQKSPDQTRNYTLAQLNLENHSNHCDSKAHLANAKLKSFQKSESEREAEERKFPLSLHNSNFLTSNDNVRFQNYPNHGIYHHPHPYFSSLYGAQSPVAGLIDHTAGPGASMMPLAMAAPYSDSIGTPSVSSNYSTTPEIVRDDEPPPKVLVPNIEEELEFLTENGRSGNAAQQSANMQTSIQGSSASSQQAKPAANQASIKTVADTKKFNTPTGPGSGFMQSYLKFLQGDRDSSPPPINRNMRKQFVATPANEQAKFNGQKRSASIDDDDYSDKGKQMKGTNKKTPRNVVDRAPQIPINTQKRSKMNDSMYDTQAMGPQLTQLQTPLQQAHQLNPVPLQSQMLQQQSMYYQQPDEGAFHYYDFHSRRQKW